MVAHLIPSQPPVVMGEQRHSEVKGLLAVTQVACVLQAPGILALSVCPSSPPPGLRVQDCTAPSAQLPHGSDGRPGHGHGTHWTGRWVWVVWAADPPRCQALEPGSSPRDPQQMTRIGAHPTLLADCSP